MRALVAVIGLGGCSFVGGLAGAYYVPPPDKPPIDCSDSCVLPIIDTVPAVAGLGLGSLFTIAGATSHSDGAVGGLILGVPMIAVGAIYAASAGHGYGAASRCRDARLLAAEQGREEALRVARSARRERAFAVTEQAAEFARAGNCAAVEPLDLQVREIDADFHDTVFVRDVAIARCLAQVVPLVSGDAGVDATPAQ